jgi:hypothetical protein
MKERIDGYESVFLLSQYIGEFQPEAQVKGLFGCNFIAFTFNKRSATKSSIFFIPMIFML